MASPSTSDAALKLEIARLTGAINQRRSNPTPPARLSNAPWPGLYVNSSFKPPSSSYVRPGYAPPSKSTGKPAPIVRPTPGPSASQTRDVTINGVAFETSRRSLVRKHLAPTRSAPTSRPQPEFTRTKNGHLIKANRVYKPKGSRHHNMTLNNRRRQFQPRRLKKIDKPCPAFNTTGTCTRGLTCAYKHDPSKIAICWPFLQGTCPHTAETCALSHDPTPERTPLCVHFANHGRCTRAACPFPHVHVPPRTGVCRDFAVLGYCERGVDCTQQHVRECPDFAETGACSNKRCKLPHVIRANRVRKAAAPSATAGASSPKIQDNETNSDYGLDLATTATSGSSGSGTAVSAEDAQLGDEYISLTFNESDSEEEESDDDDDDEDEDDADSFHVENVEEGDSPTTAA